MRYTITTVNDSPGKRLLALSWSPARSERKHCLDGNVESLCTKRLKKDFSSVFSVFRGVEGGFRLMLVIYIYDVGYDWNDIYDF